MESTSQGPVADTKLPALAAFGLAAIGLVLGLVLGGLTGTIVGCLIVLLGAAPAIYGMWKGLQQATQTSLLLSVVALIFSLAAAALLIILNIIGAVV